MRIYHGFKPCSMRIKLKFIKGQLIGCIKLGRVKLGRVKFIG